LTNGAISSKLACMRPWIAIPLLASSLIAQTTLSSHTTENLRGVSAPAHNVVWASGTHGTYLRTTDGGNTWVAAQVSGAETLDFRDIEAFDSKLAYLLAAGPGEQSRIYKTADAGATWQLQFTNHDPHGFFDCMAFWDRNRGIAVGDPVNGKFELIITRDGGKHWRPVDPNALPPAIDGEGAFAASGTCIAVQGKSNVWFATGGKAARVFSSVDGGKTWTVTDTPIVHGADSAGTFSIAFRDAKHGAIAGGDYKQPDKNGPNLAFTDDGGRTWALAPISPQWYFSAAAFSTRPVVDTPSLFVLGSAHAAYAVTVGDKSWKKTWDLNLNAIAVAPDGQACAVGPKGLIVNFDAR
jgi:photosystem II stability/assembly factor-like uncharacterized protein